MSEFWSKFYVFVWDYFCWYFMICNNMLFEQIDDFLCSHFLMKWYEIYSLCESVIFSCLAELLAHCFLLIWSFCCLCSCLCHILLEMMRFLWMSVCYYYMQTMLQIIVLFSCFVNNLHNISNIVSLFDWVTQSDHLFVSVQSYSSLFLSLSMLSMFVKILIWILCFC